jgi:hypothetical protein
MLTEKDYCDYETCVALKELGYSESFPLSKDYEVLGKDYDILLYEAQKWLREEKRILILPDYNSFGWFCGIHYPINSVKMFKYTAKEVNSYEEALSEGIKEAVKILKEK